MGRKISTEDVLWDAPLPTIEDVKIDILSPGPGGTVRAVILSDRFLSVPIHYVDGRTCPCLRIKALCEGCRRKISKRWKAYCAGCDPTSLVLYLVEITPNAVRSCPSLLEHEGSLRGRVVELKRQGVASCGKVVAQLLRWRGDVESLPPPFDVQRRLVKIWQADSRDGTSAVKLGEEGELTW